MFGKVKEKERYCFTCPFCGKKSFGFIEKNIFARHGISKIQIGETWGCKSCEIGRYTSAEDYEKAYEKINEHIKKTPELNRETIKGLFKK